MWITTEKGRPPQKQLDYRTDKARQELQLQGYTKSMKKAEDDGLEIPYDVVEFIASSIKSDIRTMEGALVRLLALSSLKRVDITMELVKKVLEDMLGKAAFTNVTIDHVLKSVSREMKVSERQIAGKGRTMEVALARQTRPSGRPCGSGRPCRTQRASPSPP